MANRNKPVSAQTLRWEIAGAVLAQHTDRRKWPLTRHIDYLFSFTKPHELYAAVGVNSVWAQLFDACVVRRKLAVQTQVKAALLALAATRTALLTCPQLVPAVAAFALRYGRRVRDLSTWQPPGKNLYRQLISLLRHCFDQYGDVPLWVLGAWARPTHVEDGVNLPDLTLHLGSGGALRAFAGLPLPLTRREAHAMQQAPADCTLREALRYGQLAGRGLLGWWGAVMDSRLGRAPLHDDGFWLGVLAWFAAAPMVDPRQFGPVCDWIQHRRAEGTPAVPAQPGFTLRGRDPAAVLAETERWHQGLARLGRRTAHLPAPLTASWEGLPVANFSGGPLVEVAIHQLTTFGQLVDEGRALHHCVATYLDSCRRGKCGIFSLTVFGERALTIEVSAERRVTQVKGNHNRSMSPDERAYVLAWLDEARLVLANHFIQ